jgi:hypothetical protein
MKASVIDTAVKASQKTVFCASTGDELLDTCFVYGPKYYVKRKIGD